MPLLSQVQELRHPKGVVGIVSPWNYPLTLAVSDALPAFVAGNAVVHKPDTQTALTALWIRELTVEAGLPPEVWQIVLGDGPTVGAAVVDGGDYVCFTGSTRVGREVAERCGRRLVGCSLELGGKNPMLVLEDADLDRAAEGAVRDCFTGAGQLCVSMERMYVVEPVHDAFLERFLARVRALRLGSALDYSADIGSLLSPAQLDRVAAHVDDAVAKGATVLAGGRARPDIGPLFYEPTVLSGVTEDDGAVPGRDVRPGRGRDDGSPTRRRRCGGPTTRRTGSTPACGRVTWRAAGGSRRGSRPGRSTSTRPTARPGARPLRRWVAARTPAWAAATGGRGCSSTPSRRPSRCSGWPASPRRRQVPYDRWAQAFTGALRVMKALGRR